MGLALMSIAAAVVVAQPSWPAGEWATRASSCGSDRSFRIEADGSYSDADGQAVWALDGDRLTVTSVEGDAFGRSQVVRITARGPDTILMNWPDGTRASFSRCQ